MELESGATTGRAGRSPDQWRSLSPLLVLAAAIANYVPPFSATVLESSSLCSKEGSRL